MTERQERVMANIVDICSFIVATAQASEQKHLLEVLNDQNRAIFVSLAFHLALARQDRRIEPQIEFQSKELEDALNPKRHWIEEKDFVQSVISAVQTKLASHVPR